MLTLKSSLSYLSAAGRTGLVALATAGLLAACGDGGSPDPASLGFSLGNTSSPAANVSTGGSALVDLNVPPGAATASNGWFNWSFIKSAFAATTFTVKLNGNTDVTSLFKAVPGRDGVLRALLTGLNNGSNTLSIADPFGTVFATLTITNFPITGPIFSGPHLTPYECRTTQNGLAAATDADCSAPKVVKYFYRGSASCPPPAPPFGAPPNPPGTPGAAACFKALADPTAVRPADLLATKTNDGITVPYIVRLEIGTINRGVYRLAMLDNPTVGTPLPATFTPGPGWNKKLLIFFGPGAGAQYNQGTQTDDSALSDTELSRGFAHMQSTEMINTQHSNPHLQGETALMIKEYFVKNIGVPKWTAGTGASGGSIQQQLVAQLYPGILDGLQPSASFPETFMAQIYECRLVNNVFKNDAGRWTTAKQVAIQGFNPTTCNSWDVGLATVLTQPGAANNCGFTDPANLAKVYNATTNPTGTVFCTLFDTNSNLLGKTARGSVRRPIDNVGVQYGLTSLVSGGTTTTDFLDFNQLVGGFDQDGVSPALAVSAGPTAVTPGAPNARSVADLDAVRLAYAGGLKNSYTGPGIANVPIISSRSTSEDTGNIHDIMEDMIIRARLKRANGSADNQVIFSAGVSAVAAGLDLAAQSLDTINTWLDNMAADPAPASMAKVVRNKPATATDACWDKSGVRINETQSTDPTTKCNVIYPRFSTLRITAGESLVSDGIKCTLKPINLADYAPVVFTAAEQARLNQIFPSGVCDWTKPGVNQVPLQGTYLTLPLK